MRQRSASRSWWRLRARRWAPLDLSSFVWVGLGNSPWTLPHGPAAGRPGRPASRAAHTLLADERSADHGAGTDGEPQELAGGELRLDFPAEAVARLTLNNPDKRNPLSHPVLDAIAETLPQLDHGIDVRCVVITGAGKAFSAGYDIGAIPDESFERDAEALVAHPFTAAMDAISAHPYPGARGDQRPLPRRRPRARGPLRPAALRGGGEARHAAREARADLRPHRPRALHRLRRHPADQGAVPDRPRLRRRAGRGDRPRQRGPPRRRDRGRVARAGRR